MNTSLNKLYLYDDVRRLLLNDGRFTCLCKDNAPMNRRDMKVHKGVDNLLKFRVFSPDRVPVKICDYDLYARLSYLDDRSIVFEKKCRLGTATGMVFLEIDEGDAANLNLGLYELAIIGVKPFVAQQREGEIVSTPFYTDFDSNIVTTVEVTNQGDKQPVPSFIITEDDWTPLLEVNNGAGPLAVSSLVSSSIPGNRVRNHAQGHHTYSIYGENMTGILEIFGTLEETPNPGLERGWFPIYPNSMSEYIEFFEHSGTDVFHFQANFMWLKFKYTPSTDVPDAGTLKKILVRS